jgi:hypothetical protein
LIFEETLCNDAGRDAEQDVGFLLFLSQLYPAIESARRFPPGELEPTGRLRLTKEEYFSTTNVGLEPLGTADSLAQDSDPDMRDWPWKLIGLTPFA